MRLPKDVSDFVKANPDFPKPKYWQKNIKQKALGTSDEELAKKKRNIELVVFQQEVDTFRKDIRGYVKLPATEDDILQLSLGEFQRLQDRDSKLQPGSPEEAKALINYTYLFGYHWGATNEGYYPNRAKELLGENGLTATDEQIDSFANLIRRAFMQQYQALKEKRPNLHHPHLLMISSQKNYQQVKASNSVLYWKNMSVANKEIGEHPATPNTVAVLKIYARSSVTILTFERLNHRMSSNGKT